MFRRRDTEHEPSGSPSPPQQPCPPEPSASLLPAPRLPGSAGPGFQRRSPSGARRRLTDFVWYHAFELPTAGSCPACGTCGPRITYLGGVDLAGKRCWSSAPPRAPSLSTWSAWEQRSCPSKPGSTCRSTRSRSRRGPVLERLRSCRRPSTASRWVVVPAPHLGSSAKFVQGTSTTCLRISGHSTSPWSGPSPSSA